MFAHFSFHPCAQPRTLLAVVAAFGLASCADYNPFTPAPVGPGGLHTAAISATATSGMWARVIQDSTGPGSVYAIYVPNAWNGDIVYYAHGFRDVAMPVDLSDQDGLYAVRDALGSEGYAVAYSSFDENGFAAKDGVQRMHQLRGLAVAALPRPPHRSFLIGYSLGAGIDLELAEQYPSQYDGALLMCGMVGGSLTQTQYVAHVRALFEYFYPGQLPGDMFSVPPGTIYTPEQIGGIVAQKPLGLYTIASIAQTPLPYVPKGTVMDPSSIAAQTLVGSLTYALGWHARGVDNIMALTHGQIPFDTKTQYVLGNPVLPPNIVSPLIAAANADMQWRFSADPAGWNYLDHNFTPTGRLSLPVLTVHSVYDSGVPIFHEDSLLAYVTRAGSTNMLLQRRLDQPFEFNPPQLNYGHCTFPNQLTVDSFHDLVQWVNSGVKPAH